MTKKRKVIQISAAGAAGDLFLYALADDGSLWVRSDNPSGWSRVVDIPQQSKH